MNKKVAIYVRVSTREQVLENQLKQLRNYINNTDGWILYGEYKDIISGKEKKRPAFDNLFDDAHKKLFDIVLFWDMSRFSRSGTLFTLQRLRELEILGIQWHSYQDKYFSTIGDFKDVVISIMATLAKIEREKISERTKAGFYRDENNVVRSCKKDKKVGRPSISPETINIVVGMLEEGRLSYSQISKEVIYKIKDGKERHISPAQISHIKKKYIKSLNLNENHLEKGYRKSHQEK